MRGKKNDLTGQVFGRLTVIEQTGKRLNDAVIWRCQCECGNTTEVPAKSLKSGSTKSCGCLFEERKVDIAGRVFGKLTALEPTRKRHHGSVVWLCQCACGNSIEASTHNLLSGGTKSCGCLNAERMSDLTGQKFGRLIALEPTTERSGPDHRCVVWRCRCECGNTVNVSSSDLKNGKRKSCGCSQAMNKRDITGQVFGRLTALQPTNKREHGSVIWLCRCKCGNTKEVPVIRLTKGTTKSCGCLRGPKLTGKVFGKLTVIDVIDHKPNKVLVWLCRCVCDNLVRATTQQLREGKVISCGCGPRRDLTGQVFGRLKVLRETSNRSQGNVVWHCQCQCGNTVEVTTSHLVSGNTKSCGCLTNATDLTGLVFGRLTAVSPTNKRTSNSTVIWLCECACGNSVEVSSNSLLAGHTQSCGCIWKEKKDLTGQVFGHLTALNPTDRRSGGSVIWRCQCVCDTIVEVAARSLRSGHTQSCGCLKKKQNKK